MNTRKNMILIKGNIKTSEIRFCQWDAAGERINIEFNNGKIYSYASSNVEWLKESQALNPNKYQIHKAGRELFDIEEIYVFKGKNDTYLHLCFCDGSERDYRQSELDITESCLDSEQAKNILAYIKQVAGLSDLRNEETGEKILIKRFEQISFVGNNVALAKYLNPSLSQQKNDKQEYIPIFPFGCNNSQYKAVKTAMENQISVIQGPPGTGKTQTILNIIANILLEGKTVIIASNNNSATENVYEKLSSSQYNLGFVAAMLGSSKNKKIFIDGQNGVYPEFSSWKSDIAQNILRQKVNEKSAQLKEVFDKREELANLKQEQAQLITEFEYFKQYMEEINVSADGLRYRNHLSAERWIALWQECQMISEEKRRIGFWFKIKGLLQYGISTPKFYKQDIVKIITTFQFMYYRTREEELVKRIAEIEDFLKSVDPGLLDNLCSQSMIILRDKLARKYGDKRVRTIFKEEDLRKDSVNFLKEYPIILSTTFSSKNSLGPNVIYDYLIMDEASQIDIVTGALALSCARNVVIVGDTKQLPNVVTEKAKVNAQAIFDSFHIHEGYQFTKSFLQSVLEVIPEVKQTLLREHYRCHPKIIDFCNQKFYRGELIIMTEDKGEEDVLTVVKTAPGNHVRNHYSQRQIDVIKQEILPKYVMDLEKTGIIAPYKNQVEALEREFKDIDVATVHKFQGKEKDTIIISTVDDEITDFADDPYLINVAVSRAKKRLMLVVTGNIPKQERNITDLIAYIQYNNFEVTESKIYSVFDSLYKQYREERNTYLKKHKRISEYDSENLMFALIEDILSREDYCSLQVVCHFQMNKLIKNMELLNEEEIQYVRNPATHVDFLLYNRISKKPVLAIEVDGYNYHKEGTVQASRDQLKNHILELYKLPLIRFRTNGSEEKERLIKALKDIL